MKLKIKYIPFILLFTQVTLFSQASSSYTRYGIGNIAYSYSANELGIGQLGISIVQPGFISLNNPASWNKLITTRFETSMSYTGLYLSDFSNKDFNGKAQFNGFAFAFPVSVKHGISVGFGIVPYSKVNYQVVQNYTSPETSDQYSITYQGQGGLSKLFIGTSYNLPFNLSVGATFEYYFGNINYSATSDFTNSGDVSAQYNTSYQPDGLGTTFGLISPDFSDIFNSKSITDFKLGLAVNYINSLSTDTLLTTYTSSRSTGTDTIGFGTTKMKIPVRISAGLSLVLDKNYLFTLDAASQGWSNYTFNNLKIPELQNSLLLSAGFEYRPKEELGASVWEQIIWRAGLSYEKTQYKINNIGINQYAVSGGFSFPLSYANTIDFAVQYGIRGKKESNLIKENFIKINFGLSLGELWFIRRNH